MWLLSANSGRWLRSGFETFAVTNPVSPKPVSR